MPIDKVCSPARSFHFNRLESAEPRRSAPVLSRRLIVLKFSAAKSARHQTCPSTFVRGVDDGAIRCLEVRHGLPFSMEIEQRISRGMPDVKGEHVEAV